MQLQMTTIALLALAGTQVASSHIVRTPLESAVNMNMDDTAESGLEARSLIPHDVPDHPHCTFKGKDSAMYMVFSKDFGRNDETSKGGCGSDMLHHLRKGTSMRSEHPYLVHDDYVPSFDFHATTIGV